MHRAELIKNYQYVWHITDEESLESIRADGLLSPERLCARYAVPDTECDRLLRHVRPRRVRLTASGRPDAWLGDHKPLSPIEPNLTPGSSRELLLWALSTHVFFFARPDKIASMHASYPERRMVRLTLSTERLVDAHAGRIDLCRMNTGAPTRRAGQTPRGHDSFIPLAQYPWDDYRRRFGAKNALAEVTVRDAVPDLFDLVVGVDRL